MKALTLKAPGSLNDKVTAAWNAELAAGTAESVVLDLSAMPGLDAAGTAALVRWLAGPVGAGGFRIMVLCSGAVEAKIELAGLGDKLECFPAPEAEQPRALEGGGDGAALSALCGHLITGVERVTGTLFDEGLSYRPPVSHLADVTSELGPGVEGAFVQADSPQAEVKMLFLVKSDDKKQLARAFFRGREMPESASKDLVAEIANNVLGDVIRHLPHDGEVGSLKAGLPKTLSAPLRAPDMGAATVLSFLNDDSEIKLIIGWNPKC